MESTTASSSSSEEDLLTQLPSDVLVSILEKLSLREAVRVRVLSRRWRCLSARLSRLDLDIASFLPDDDAGMPYDHDDGSNDGEEAAAEDDVEEPAAGAAAAQNAVVIDNPDADAAAADGPAVADHDDDVFSEAGDKMADVARMLLLASRTRSPRLRPSASGGDDNYYSLDGGGDDDDDDTVYNEVAMRFYLRHNYMSLGRLLEDAVSSGKARKVKLTITNTFPLFDDALDGDSIRRSLVGYGRRFKSLLDACPATFGAQLTELRLEKMKHGGPDLGDILGACTRLEKLTLESCGPVHAAQWRVRHAWLKDMSIRLCFIGGIQLLWLPRLERFSMNGWYCTSDRLVSFGHVPRLTAVTMAGDIINKDATFRLSRFFANTDNNAALTDLSLNFCGNNIWVRPETSRRLTDAFSNLKNLKLKNVNRECGLSWTMFLLQSAPHLQQLYIKLMEHNCGDLAGRKNVPWEVDSNFKHHSLVRVTIARFYSTQETIVTFIRCLIQAAVNLEQICFREAALSLCTYCDRIDPNAASKFPQTDQEKDAFTKRIITDEDGRSTTAVKIHIRS